MTLDRHAEQVRRRLKKGDVLFREAPGTSAIRFQDAEAVAVAADYDVDRPLDAVFQKQGGRPETGFFRELVRDHRLSRVKRVPRWGRGARIQLVMADHAIPPADPGAEQQLIFVSQILENFA